MTPRERAFLRAVLGSFRRAVNPRRAHLKLTLRELDEALRSAVRESPVHLDGEGGSALESRGDLGRVQQHFGLNLQELARLFGVSRQAASAWLGKGVPANRLGKLVTILEIADVLARQLKPGRLAGVARKAAAAYGGLSLLEMIEADRHEELLELVRRSFDWAATA